MSILVKFCEKIAKKEELLEEIKKLQEEIKERDIILKRIKIVSTCNHYGSSVLDREYRQQNCLDFKTRKIFELASEFDKDDKLDFWQTLDDLEEDKIIITDNEISILEDE